jgi:site-specific DNA-methyltransferase (adenine-specific)
MTPYYQSENGSLFMGDCLEVMKTLPDNHFSSVITDAPYGLSFMGKKWDYDVPGVEVWEECLRVLKPGGTALIFAGSRTQHRMAVNVEDAGFILKDCIMWLYGSGFPKSTDISKQIDKGAGVERKIVGVRTDGRGRSPQKIDNHGKGDTGIGHADGSRQIYNVTIPATPEGRTWEGWGTALKPAYEPILICQKPNDGTYAQNALTHGVAGLNIDGSRISVDPNDVNRRPNGSISLKESDSGIFGMGGRNPDIGGDTLDVKKGRFPANVILNEEIVPVLCLTESNQDSILTLGKQQLIEEYYHDYELPTMWKRIQGISESSQEWQEKILQQTMLSQKSKQQDEGRESFSIRQKTHAGINKENEKNTISKCEKRQRQSEIQRNSLCKWLCNDQYFGADEERKKNSLANDGEREKLSSFTSSKNGDETRETAQNVGSCSSSKWSQGRQSNRKSGMHEQYNSQNGTQGDIERAKSIKNGKRKIEILASDVPEKWLQYFELAGYSLENPNSSAALLDEQSGVLKSGAKIHNSNAPIYGGNSLNKSNTKGEGQKFKSSEGGASRFFYTAKSSKSERNMGCEGLEDVKDHGHYAQDEWSRNNMGNCPDNKRLPTKNNHPCVKPLSLMKYLCTLTKTPTGGTVLDPFAGSSTTGLACIETGRPYVLIEREAEYCEISKARLEKAERHKLAIGEQTGF